MTTYPMFRVDGEPALGFYVIEVREPSYRFASTQQNVRCVSGPWTTRAGASSAASSLATASEAQAASAQLGTDEAVSTNG